MAWVAPQVVKFRLRRDTYPYREVDAFRVLCDSFFFCYPELLAPQDPENYLQERSKSTDVWILEGSPGARRLIRELHRHDRHDLGVVTSLHHAERLARTATQRRTLSFAPHPQLSVTLALWGSAHERVPACFEPLIRELQATFTTPSPSPPADPRPATVPSAHILFFDGGSRGNPGPGGSGACVVRVDAVTSAPTIVWSASTSYAHRATTNNQAEYQGLLAARITGWQTRWPISPWTRRPAPKPSIQPHALGTPTSMPT